MRYHTYSEAAHEASTIEDTQPIKDVFNSLSHDRQHLIDGLLTLQEISPDSVADYVGDTQMARMVISSLVKNKCLTRQGPSNYTKNPAFVEWLRAEKQ